MCLWYLCKLPPKDMENIVLQFLDIDHCGYVCQLLMEALHCVAWYWQGIKVSKQYEDLKVYWSLHAEILVCGAFLKSTEFLLYKKYPQSYPLKTLLGEVHSESSQVTYYPGTGVSKDDSSNTIKQIIHKTWCQKNLITHKKDWSAILLISIYCSILGISKWCLSRNEFF
jgi:hypothetical protein